MGGLHHVRLKKSAEAICLCVDDLQWSRWSKVFFFSGACALTRRCCTSFSCFLLLYELQVALAKLALAVGLLVQVALQLRFRILPGCSVPDAIFAPLLCRAHRLLTLKLLHPLLLCRLLRCCMGCCLRSCLLLCHHHVLSLLLGISCSSLRMRNGLGLRISLRLRMSLGVRVSLGLQLSQARSLGCGYCLGVCLGLAQVIGSWVSSWLRLSLDC
mmetsp:Transcript_67936/g.122417  ORF Transcript_67936/g.122417 Transcript_67936/m.122417 type:complete len:214 (+) Transcript_67936:1207-1848(+)